MTFDCYREAAKLAQKEVDRLENEAKRLETDLKRKRDEINKANQLETRLEEELRKKQTEFEEAKRQVNDLKTKLETVNGQLDQANKQLAEYKEALLQEKLREDQMRKAHNDQQKTVNDAQRMLQQRTDEESRAEREYKEALRNQLDAEDILRRYDDELRSAETALRIVQAAAAAITIFSAGTGIGAAAAAIVFAEGVIRACQHQLDGSRQDVVRRKQIREEKYQTHQKCIQQKKEAETTLQNEKGTLVTRYNDWQQQILTRQSAERRVTDQTSARDRIENTRNDLKRDLIEAINSQTAKEEQVKEAKTKVQKQSDQIDVLNDQQNVLEDQQRQNQTRLSSAIQAKQNADTQYQKAVETEAITVNTLNEKKRLQESTRVQFEQTKEKLDAKNADLINKERVALEAKNKVTAIEDDLKRIDMHVSELQTELIQQETLRSNEERKLQTCKDTKLQAERDIETMKNNKQQLEKRCKELKLELNSKNQEMQTKNIQIMNTEAQIKVLRKATDDNQNNKRHQQNNLDQVHQRIGQFDTQLTDKQNEIRSLTQTLTRHETDLQIQKDTVLDSQRKLENYNIQHTQLTSQINEKQQVLNQRQGEHEQLSKDVDEMEARKDELDDKSRKLHNQRMDMTFVASSAARSATRQQIEISEIKEKRLDTHKQQNLQTRRRHDTRLNPNLQTQRR